MERLKELKVRENLSGEEVFQLAVKKFHLAEEKIESWRIVKKSIDARNKSDVHFVYVIEIEWRGEKKIHEQQLNNIVRRRTNQKPVVIGAGPAGLFAAYILAQNGFSPIVIEQGKPVEERKADVETFKKTGKLDVLSNIQFGEGGAGTFSDGKLNTGIHSPYCQYVLETFVKFGAPQQILYESKPHVGTDYLLQVIKNMREEIIRLGGTFLFQQKVTDFIMKEESITAVIAKEKIETDTVILAIGHSARDTFEKLYNLGIHMEAKSFSVGARIEHLQKMINESQYGIETKLQLPAADYKLVHHGKERALYTFCMCPGGVVVPSTSEEGAVVTNGMSYFARDGENANSAILVGVNPQDFAGNHPLRGMYFQRELEQKAFEIGGKNYCAPAQRVEDFLAHRQTTKWGVIKPSYMPGVTMADLHEILPSWITDTMEEGIQAFDQKLKGFAHPDAVLTGVETRSSSPVRIMRNEDFVANVKGIYPCGEGAGYAGGIMSAAVDGIKVATKILSQ